MSVSFCPFVAGLVVPSNFDCDLLRPVNVTLK